jgi:hypothetical protein
MWNDAHDPVVIRGFTSECGACENELSATVGAGDENKEGSFFLKEGSFYSRAIERRSDTFTGCRNGAATHAVGERGAVIHSRAALHVAGAAVQDYRCRTSHKSVVAVPRKQNVAQSGVAGLRDLWE